MRPAYFAALCFALLFVQSDICLAQINNWRLPAAENSAQPNLSKAANGDLILSWIQRDKTAGHRLMFARYTHEQKWTAAKTVATGKNFFVNWADFPSVQALPDGSLWAHALERSGSGTYDYDVTLRRSVDNGNHWSAPVIVHDSRGGEHGFVSLWPVAKNNLGVVWLDSNQPEQVSQATHSQHGAHDGHGNRMTMRSAVFDSNLIKRRDDLLDAMTCDCCQTDVAITGNVPIVVYRDRSKDEIRDIFVTRFQNGLWSKPVRVYADNWKMPACPVNGPAIAAQNNDVWVAWYTAAGKAKIQLAHTANNGQQFQRTITVSENNVEGRVDVVATDNSVWVSWLTEADKKQTVWLAEYSKDLRKPLQRFALPAVQGQGRGTGFPRMQITNDRLHFVWTDIVAGTPRLRGYTVNVVNNK